MFMSGKDYRGSLGAYKPSVYVNGRKVKSVAADAELAPGVNAIALTYDYALRPELAPLMRARQHDSGREVNRLIHVGTQQRRPAEQAGSGAPGVPGDRLRPALSRPATPSTRCTRRRTASTRKAAATITSASSLICTIAGTRPHAAPWP